jgi:tRNA pseudouridine55 synthase
LDAEDRNGLLLLDKPSGPTSHDLVYAARRLTGQRRIGHAGTLDPLASGLLPLVLGRATRLVRFLFDSPKVYEGTLRLGLTTDTDDVTGRPGEPNLAPLPSPESACEAARRMEGRQLQRPPTYSARKVGGERMYRLARKGIVVDAAPREVTVDRFRLEPTRQDGVFAFESVVSTGTYVRALARDLGAKLGCGAVLETLRRTRIGPMAIEQAVRIVGDEADARRLSEALVPLSRMPLEPPPHRIEDAALCRRFTEGGVVELEPPRPADGLLRVVAPSGVLLGVGECRDGYLRPRVVVAEEGWGR